MRFARRGLPLKVGGTYIEDNQRGGVRRMVFWILAIMVVAVLAYIRLAPSDLARWHVQASGSDIGDHPRADGRVWRQEIVGNGRDQLRDLDRIILDTPRTTRLTGSVDAGQVTYVTRSAVMGFPDYTTVGVYGDNPRYLEIYGRLRFGRSDLGVNAKRIEGWLAAFEAGG